MFAIIQEDTENLRKYLLSQLTEEDEERVELRLLADADYSEALEITADELIDQYVGEELSEEEHKLIEQHFFNSQVRRDKLRFAVALKKQRAELISNRFRRRKLFLFYLPIAACVLIVLGLSLGAWRLFFASDLDKGLTALRSAYGEQRPIEARIAGFGYAPFAQMRGDEQGKVDYTSRDRAERIIRDTVNDHPDAASYYALGQFYLAERQFDKAIDQFEKALQLDPNNARLHSDMGAALLERGKVEHLSGTAGKGMETFARSLDHFNKALELDTSLPDALFNRAILYQSMMLPAQAEADWMKYLEKDSNSPWAEEARKNLRLLEEQKKRLTRNSDDTLQSFEAAYRDNDTERAWEVFNLARARTGNIVVERLIDAYLTPDPKTRPEEAEGKIRMLLYAGEIEAQKAGDHFTSDIARFYSRASPQQLEVLARARGLIKAGNDSYNRVELETAIAHYTEAKRLFEQAGDACETLFAESWIGYCYLRIPDTKRSLPTFERLAKAAEERNYKALLAQSLHATADAQTSIDELSKALEYAERSLKISEEIQDKANVLRCLQVFLSVNLKLGNYHESLSSVWQAFSLLQTLPSDPKLVWPFYHETASALYWLELPAAALEFQKEALRLAEESKWALIKSRSYARLGLIYEKLQNYEEAIRNGRLALEEGKTIVSEKSRFNTIAYSSLILGQLYMQAGDFNESLRSYDQALELYEKLDLSIYLYRAHRGKLLTYMALGDDAAAGTELEIALSLFEQYRPKIFEERNKNSFFDVGQGIYDIATDFAYSRMRDPRKAFEYAESSHARSLLDLVSETPQVVSGYNGLDLRHNSSTRSLGLFDIQQQIPARAQILQYAVLEDKLIIWVISRTEFQYEERPIDAGELDAKVATYLRLIRKRGSGKNDDETEALAKDLYGILVSPVERFLDRNLQLCIVPDKILNFLPFSALVSPQSGKYFIEDYSLLLSPSSNIFIACSDVARRKEGAGYERPLVIGNPSYNRRNFPDLPDLPSAGREAEEIAARYHAHPLIGERAREKLIREEMPKAGVIHFAAHYVVNDSSPLLSSLLLAKEPPENSQEHVTDGVLQSIEVYQVKLPQTRLVVLSACQTGIERSYRGEGAISIARPFISAGVPIVVASLWPVESDSTKDLMVSFYRHRKQLGLPTAQALQQAQLEMLRSQEKLNTRPHVWAAFTAIGGYADF
ncbi:MAG TPA: CHAT domain-containing protein [Blastocatellia bacterium]|nr:CHAT domain-containing protein [Blastocatellia bacterium]